MLIGFLKKEFKRLNFDQWMNSFLITASVFIIIIILYCTPWCMVCLYLFITFEEFAIDKFFTIVMNMIICARYILFVSFRGSLLYSVQLIKFCHDLSRSILVKFSLKLSNQKNVCWRRKFMKSWEKASAVEWEASMVWD